MTGVRLFSLLGFGLLIASCGRDVPDAGGGGKELGLFIEPPTLDLYLDHEFTFDVRLSDEEAEKSVLNTADLTLELGKPDLVEVNKDGTGTAKAAGTTALIASYLGFQSEAAITIHDGELVGIEVVPREIRLAIGQNTQIRVTGNLDNGDQLDLTRGYQGTRYESTDPSVATVSTDGLVLAEKEGTTTVRVTHGRFNGSVSIEVTTTQVELTSLFIEPSAVSLEFGESFQLGVFGTDTNGNQIDVIAAGYPVGFTSSDTTIATVNETALVTAQRRSGVTTIVAKLGDLTASAEIRVRPPEAELIDLLVEPEFSEIKVGEQLQLRVTGRYLDGSTADLTLGSSGTTYFSSEPMGFSVNGDGLVSAIGGGVSGFVVVTHGIFERLAFITVVGDGRLIGIEVQPFSIDLIVGGFLQLQVVAFYSDGSIIDITDSSSGVQYFPPMDGIITVTPDGFVQANFTGGGALRVEYQGFEVFVPVTVIDQMQIAFIFISPGFISVPEGGSSSFQVFAQLNDGTLIDLTFDPQLALSVDRPAIADYVALGTVQGFNAGITTLRAAYFGFTAAADIEVTGMRVLVGIRLSIPPQILVNQTVMYRVLGLYSDGTTQDVTFHPQTQVVSVEPAILDVNFGLASGVSPGFSLVIADHQLFSDSFEVEVTPNADPIVAISFQPGVLNIPVNGVGVSNLIAVRQSGIIEDITFDPGVVYSPTGPISATLGLSGLEVGGFAPGTGEVIATYQGLTARLTVNIGMTSMIVGIDIVAPVQVDVGGVETFFVVAFFSDGSFADITFDMALSMVSSNPNVLALMTPSFTGVSAGTANITASYMGFTDVHTVVVGNDPVVGLMFVPSSLSMDVGVQATAQVIATFQSGATANVTFDPNLNVTTNGPITIFPGAGGNILIDAFASGMASITATYEGFTATLPITISNRILVSIEIIVSTQLDIFVTEPYQVIAHFSDGSTQDVTFDMGVSISVGDPMVLSAGGGVVTGLAIGQTNLMATYQGISTSVRIEVVGGDAIIALSWNPPQLAVAVGGSDTANVIVLFQSGNTLDVTGDPATTFTTSGPISTQLQPGGLRVTGNAQGNGQVTASYMGFVAGLPVTVGNAPMLIDIRVEPDNVQLAEGDTQQLTVIGIFSDGSEAPITGAGFINFDPSIAEISPTGLITALSPGSSGVLVTFGAFAVFVQIEVFSAMGPTIISINPGAVVAGSAATLLTVTGTGFVPGDAIFVDGLQLTTTFVSPTQLTAQVPAFLLTFPTTLDVQVRGMNGRSNIVPLLVGEIPIVTSYSPDSVFQGSSVVVTVIGSGLTGLAYSATGLTITEVAASFDGTWVQLRITAAAATSVGFHAVVLSNPLGMDSIQIEVIATQNLPDLVVVSGQTVTLNGTHVYANVTVQTGGRIIGGSNDTLAIIASNSITIRGTIDVSGDPGEQGFTTPADGGNAGAGGAGGGGGGDGNAVIPANGGAGDPDGFDAFPGFGSGTPGGDGGGEGGGGAGAFGCGHGGGGGGFRGSGGNGGGDFGQGTGGFGGFSGGRGSDFGNGTGGGGGSTCGNASGGGGGGGGGGLLLQVAPGGTILVDGAILANGGAGGDGFQNTGGGGGGSGGRVDVIAPNGSITINDTISARGGNGGDTDFGDTGGGGGGGHIVIDANGGTANVGLGLLVTDGANAGASLGTGFPGEAGTDGISTITP